MKTSYLDLQWLSLIMEAKEIGLTPKEISAFLDSCSNKQDATQLNKNN
ncbi:anti-repressor SinI family protein [Peribacillus muralis]|nr:anti-repressor SinI family protein [Peribacillus muralis]